MFDLLKIFHWMPPLMQPSPFIQALEVRWRVAFLWRVNAETCCASLSCEFTLDKREYKALCEISKTSNQKWGYLMYHMYSSLLCDIKCIP